jgi:hypothetical protein
VTLSALLVEPAFHTAPGYARTLGPEVADLARLAGFGPDPEQELALDDLFALDANGRAAAFEFAVICARQNLKTGLFKQATLGWLFITDQRLVVWSAHEFSTSQEAFRDMTELIEGCPQLSRRVRRIYRGNGEESIELVDNRRLIFKARTKGGGRGLTGDKVVLDEAFALQPIHMGALLPTLTARPDPQVVYGSSAGLVDSAVLRGVRDRGRPGTSPRLAYMEWGTEPGGCVEPECSHLPGVVTGCMLDDVSAWRRANPQLGGRIDVETLEAHRQAMPAHEFAREFLGWWDKPAELDPVVDMVKWDRLANARAKLLPGRVALSVAVSNDRAWGSIGVAGPAARGRVLLMVRSGRGSGWLVDEVVRLKAKHKPVEIALDPATQAGALIPALEAARVDVTSVGSREMGQACGAFLNAIDEGERFTHTHQAQLDTAVAAAGTRDVGDAQRWDTRSNVDLSPLVAVTIAAQSYAKHALADYQVLDSFY